MKRIQTLETRDLAKSLKTGGCGECQTFHSTEVRKQI